MASADVASGSASVPSTPNTSEVYSTASTSGRTLQGLSRHSSVATLTGDEPTTATTTGTPGGPGPGPALGIHRVSSEQLLPTTSELTVQLANAPARATSMVLGKVTSRRRQRNPRRFVVTELPPETDEFLAEPSPSPPPPPPPPACGGENENHTGGRENGGDAIATSTNGRPALSPQPATKSTNEATASLCRPKKMEVRGRFTIIDLSPDSPSSHVEDPPPVGSAEPPRPVRGSASSHTANGGGAASRMRRAVPPRRFSRGEKSSSMTMASASASSMLPESAVLTAAMLRGQDDRVASNSHGRVRHSVQSQPPQLSPHGVDLTALDRHLVFLQQESLDMKAVLESMISSNSRWISALADSSMHSGPNPKAVHPAACSPTMRGHSPNGTHISPSLPPPPLMAVPVCEPTLEDKYEKLLLAHTELQHKHDVLAAESAQLKRSNLMLETRLRQETSVNEELRAHVDQLTQYTETLIYGAGDPLSLPRGSNNSKSEPKRRQEALSSACTDATVESGEAQSAPPTPQALHAPEASPPRSQNHQRSASLDSTALWVLENNQSGLEDDDDDDNESNVDADSDELDRRNRNGRATAATRRRRWRHVSRSTSMSLEDDSASSVYSSSYRDSWVSLFDPQHASSVTSDWRSFSYDAGDSSVEDTLFELATPRKARHDSSDSVGGAEPTNNQTEDDERERSLLATLRRRKSSQAMIVEELEDNPASPTDTEAAPEEQPVE